MAIRGLWKNVSLTCARDGNAMELDHKYNYSCPACGNFVPVTEFEKMLSRIQKQIVENERSGIVEDLTGFRFSNRKRDIRYAVKAYDGQEYSMSVSADNVLAGKNG